MDRCMIGAIYNKNTKGLVCPQYYNKSIREIIDVIGEPLKIRFENGSFFTHELVLSHEQTDYGFWVETTFKNWRFDWI